MRTELSERLEIEFPIFAFSHCRDVVAAVSRAGGFGVLGALAFSPEQLELELRWIDEHCDGKPYGVDVVIPRDDPARGSEEPAALAARLRAQVPEGHRAFAKQLLDEHGVPDLPPDAAANELVGWTQAIARPQIASVLEHERVRLVANALGTPPVDLIGEIQRSGRLVAALAGSPRHALAHRDAGVDVIIAQGHESAAHTGDLTSLVLWPQVVDAVAPVPVLAAGGIGTGRHILAALGLGAQGVWTGSIWLTVEEADTEPAERESYLRATSSDTQRTRSFTGKPNRMLRNDWTEAWQRPDTPDPLPMPLQGMAVAESMARIQRYRAQAQNLAPNSVGQIVGMMNEVVSCRELIHRLADEYLDAFERVEALQPR
jgi:NAD(P)H-dependent flavin oxidoreductase YrpB (nitropropane dioxygenase family)